MSGRHRVFLTLWQYFWHHDVFWLYFEILTHFWRYDVLLTSSHIFDVVTNFLTIWRKFWRHDVMNLLTLWRTFWGYDVINISWQQHNTQPNTYKYIRMMMWSDFVWYVSCVFKSIHTTTLSFGLNRSIWNYFGHHKDVWYFMQNPLAPHQGCLLTSTYCTCYKWYIHYDVSQALLK